ncbi:hypothetical protein C8J56DRAFT_1048397 [Mycena floridula]|nr:hypothetical protein C8J56DRAFT_1048397 [Mycena floridula]
MDAQLGTALPKESNPTLATGSYVREAKIYDDGMVARWKVLMDGLLLFAALFSAVVTAFIIESYKNLSPDPSTTTVLLLYQISQQLSMITNTTELKVSLPDYSSSPKLASNGHQTTYVRAIERRERPEIRARIRAYLFEGVENSNVAAIVEGTPLLLHASLFSFFIGLVFFLHPINTAMTFLTASILAVFGAAYLSATIAPFIDTSASPIRTPLTTLVMQFSFVRNFNSERNALSLHSGFVYPIASWTWSQGCLEGYDKVFRYCRRNIRATRKRLSDLATWIHSRLKISKQNILDTVPSSEIDDSRPPGFNLFRPDTPSKQRIPFWFMPFKDIWSDNTLCRSKGIPLYLESGWPNLHFGEEQVHHRYWHQPHLPVSCALHCKTRTQPFYYQSWKLSLPLDASAVVKTLLSLFERNVIPYTEATSYLHPSSLANLSSFLREVIKQHSSLAPAGHRLESTAIIRCAQAQDRKYSVKGSGDCDWPFWSVCHIPDAIRQSSQLHPFWSDILSFVGIE